MWRKVKNLFLNLLFPKFCFGCKKEGTYLCQDCQSVLGILSIHQKFQTQNLNDLYFAVPYQKPLVKNLIQRFKYEPFVKELAETLSSLIISHFQLLDNKPDFFYPVRDRGSSNGADYILVPIPLEKKRLKWRGFNQAEELAKDLAGFFNLKLSSNVLIKTKTTPPQVDLENEDRKRNIKGVFEINNKELIKGQKILLVDDVYTTGSTMEECSRILKNADAKEIIGVVVARG